METINSKSFLEKGNRSREVFADASDLTFTDCVFEHCNSLRTTNQLNYNNLIFNNCTFNQCNLGHPDLKVNLRNIKLFNSTQCFSHLQRAHLLDVTINNLRTTGRGANGMLFLNGCFYNNLQLIGKIGIMKLNVLPTLMHDTKEQEAYIAALKEHYENVPVAIDVRYADFTTFISLDVVPGDKVLFNPNAGAVLHRTDLEGLELNEFAAEESILRQEIFMFRKFSPFDSIVLLANSAQKPKERALDMTFLEHLFKRNLVRSAEPSHNTV